MAVLSKAEAVLAVRRRINEPTASTILDAQIEEWLNRGARQVSSLTLCKPTSEITVLTINKMNYIQTANFIKIASVSVATSAAPTDVLRGLQRINPWQIGHVALPTSGIVNYWTAWGKDGDTTMIGVYPTAVATGNSMHAHGFILAEEYGTSGDQLPIELNNLAIIYAVACYHIREGRHQKAALELQKFFSMCMNARSFTYTLNEIPDTADMRKLADVKVLPQQQ